MKVPNSILGAGLIVAILSLTVPTTVCEHIVFLHHISTHSHLVATWNFAEALASKGHKITYISGVPPPSKSQSISFVFLPSLDKLMKVNIDTNFDVSTRLSGDMPLMANVGEAYNAISCGIFLGSEELQSWLNKTPKVDLIYVDGQAECVFGLAYKLEAKLAIFLTYGILPKLFENFGIPFESSSIPTFDFPFKTPMSFFERVKTTLMPLLWNYNQISYWRQIENDTKKHLHLSYLPPMDELFRNISLIMTNSHYLDDNRRSLPPFVVSVPGMHVKETHESLPKEIESFINSPSSTGEPSEGFIYISLGTLAKAPKLPLTIRQVFFNSIEAFPKIRFLWRWDGEFPTGVPQNLKLSKWFNQQDLLGHPKIRGFITQAGRPSSQEAVYNAVPIITFPILGDQDFNANILEELGVSINLEIADVSEEQLKNSLHNILYDSKFKDRSIEVAQLYKDVPMKPVDTAVWWTEYILRHKDTSHLKPLAMGQTWYQRRLLDVWAFIGILLLILVFLSYVLLRTVYKLFVIIAKSIIGHKKLKKL